MLNCARSEGSGAGQSKRQVITSNYRDLAPSSELARSSDVKNGIAGVLVIDRRTVEREVSAEPTGGQTYLAPAVFKCLANSLIAVTICMFPFNSASQTSLSKPLSVGR